VIGGLLLLAGCGRSGPETVEVHGHITFDGQPPPGGGEIIYVPVETPADHLVRPAMAVFEEDGYFEVSSFAKGDGLVPGKYNVTVECWIRRPTGLTDPGVSAMPPNYGAPQLSIEPGTDGPINVEYDVPTK
jgi:hypothetical protein